MHSAAGSAGAPLGEVDAGSAIGDAPTQVKTKTQGNPLAAGLIAFGAGLLGLLPDPGQPEGTRSRGCPEDRGRTAHDGTHRGRQTRGGGLKEPAQAAMENVKATATDATEHVKAEGQGAVADVKDRTVRGQGQRPAGLIPFEPGRPSCAHAPGGRPMHLNPEGRTPMSKNPAAADTSADAETPGEQHRQGPNGARSGRFTQAGQPHRCDQTVVEVHREEDSARIHEGPVPRPRRGPHLLLGPLAIPRALGARVPARHFRAGRKDHVGAPGDRPGLRARRNGGRHPPAGRAAQ